MGRGAGTEAGVGVAGSVTTPLNLETLKQLFDAQQLPGWLGLVLQQWASTPANSTEEVGERVDAALTLFAFSDRRSRKDSSRLAACWQARPMT